MAVFGMHNLAVVLPAWMVATLLNLVFGLHHRVLLGLRAFSVPGAEPAGAAAGAKKVKAKSKAGSKDKEIDLGGAENLLQFRLHPARLTDTPFLGMLENMVMLGVMAVLTFALSEASARLLSWELTTMPLVVSLGLCACGSLAILAGSNLLSVYTSRQDKAYALVFGFLGLVLALGTLQLPPRLVGWDVQAAAAATGPLLAAAAKRHAAHLADLEAVPDLPAGILTLALAAIAAAVSTLLFAPCLRFARGYWLQHNPPAWAAELMGSGPIGLAAFNLQLLLPAVSALLWLRPLGPDLFGFDASELAFMRAGLLLAAAAVAAMNSRRLVQRFLDGALLAWHQIKHSGGGTATGGKRVDPAALGNLVRANCQVVLLLLGRAALQALAPALLFLGLGLALLFSALHPSVADGAANANALIDGIAGFLAFWASATYFLLSAACIWLFKTGTLRA